MIFAKFQYDVHYDEMHQPIVDCLLVRFPELQHGHQGDSWIWITEGDQKVEIDTFYAMYHEVKARQYSPLVSAVLAELETQFDLYILEKPESDPADDIDY